MDITTEVKKELKNGETWVEQIVNILRSSVWAFGTVITGTAVTSTLVLLIVLITDTGNGWTFQELQKGVTVTLTVCSAANLGVVLLFGLPIKLRNVFRENAENSISRKEKIQHEIELEIDITETLLTQYGLISEQDKKDRRAKLKNGLLY